MNFSVYISIVSVNMLDSFIFFSIFFSQCFNIINRQFNDAFLN